MEANKLLIVNLGQVEIYKYSNIESESQNRATCTSFLKCVNGGVSQSFPTITIIKERICIEIKGAGVRGTYLDGPDAKYTLNGSGCFDDIVPGTYRVYVQGSIFGDGEIKSIVHYNE